MMDAASRGKLIHKILERFFLEQQARGRPKQYEAWTAEDREALMCLGDEGLGQAEERGLTGLSVYSMHGARTIKADLPRLIDEDTLFRQRTGAVRKRFQTNSPQVKIGGAQRKV